MLKQIEYLLLLREKEALQDCKNDLQKLFVGTHNTQYDEIVKNLDSVLQQTDSVLMDLKEELKY